MVVDEDFAVENALERFLAEIAFLAVIGLRIEPHLPVDREIAHAGRRHAALAAIDTLGILAAGHLHAVGRAGEFHPLHGPRGNVLQRDRASACEIGRTRQDLQAGDAAIGQRTGETRVLRPHRMFGPDLGCHRAGRLVPVRMRLHAGGGIVAEVRMDVDHPGGDEFAAAVDPVVTVGGQRGIAHRDDLAIAEQHGAVVYPAAAPVEDGGADQRRRAPGIGGVGRGEGDVAVLSDRRRPVFGRGRSDIAAAARGGTSGKRDSGRAGEQGVCLHGTPNAVGPEHRCPGPIGQMHLSVSGGHSPKDRPTDQRLSGSPGGCPPLAVRPGLRPGPAGRRRSCRRPAYRDA